MEGGRENLKMAATNEDSLTLLDGQSIMRVLSHRGDDLIEVMNANGEKSLALIPIKFQWKTWLKNGSFVVVDESVNKKTETGSKITCIVTQVLLHEQVCKLQKSPEWPEIFKEDYINGRAHAEASCQEAKYLNSCEVVDEVESDAYLVLREQRQDLMMFVLSLELDIRNMQSGIGRESSEDFHMLLARFLEYEEALSQHHAANVVGTLLEFDKRRITADALGDALEDESRRLEADLFIFQLGPFGSALSWKLLSDFKLLYLEYVTAVENSVAATALFDDGLLEVVRGMETDIKFRLHQLLKFCKWRMRALFCYLHDMDIPPYPAAGLREPPGSSNTASMSAEAMSVDYAMPMSVDYAMPMSVDYAMPMSVDYAMPMSVDFAMPSAASQSSSSNLPRTFTIELDDAGWERLLRMQTVNRFPRFLDP